MFSLFILAIDAKERQKWIDKLRTCSGSNAAEVVSRYHSIENNYFQSICSPSLYRHYRLREIVWLTRRRLQMNLKLVHLIDEIPSMIECFLSHENWQIFFIMKDLSSSANFERNERSYTLRRSQSTWICRNDRSTHWLLHTSQLFYR